ncbi:putative toxin-antitoxin system toxin component, PIN family [Candidatus Woesearchaeota archaeon]|nr:putative toxin-antitoxin system toxin component, PIN family [Candidatus Woesearchaeota archaeon]
MKVTVDTNFLISSTQWNYSVAHKLLIKFIEQEVKIFTTKDILDEFEKVLERDFKYDKTSSNNLIEKIISFVHLVEPKDKVDVIKDDPDDNIIIECALESNSEFIITYDKHLLNIKENKGIKIITPEIARNILE